MSENKQETIDRIEENAARTSHEEDKKAGALNNRTDNSEISRGGHQSDVLDITRISVEEVAIDGICGVY